MKYKMVQAGHDNYTVQRLVALSQGEVWITVARNLTRKEALQMLEGRQYAETEI